jgi:hypothetical protein
MISRLCQRGDERAIRRPVGTHTPQCSTGYGSSSSIQRMTSMDEFWESARRLGDQRHGIKESFPCISKIPFFSLIATLRQQ